MIDARTLQDLQVRRLVAAAAERTQTGPGRARLLTLPEAGTRESCQDDLVRVDEATGLLDLPEHPSLDGVEDVSPSVASAAKGGVLSAGELIACARLIRRGGEALDLVADLRLRAPALADAFPPVRDLRPIAERIESTFDEEGRIRDDASPRLGDLRQKGLALGRRVKERIQAMLHDTEVLSTLQDDYYTLREGRYVLPVKAEDHRFVPGIIHGTSQTGATFFVEPVSIVDDNNLLKIVVDQIEMEEVAVLADRSRLLGRFSRDVLLLSDELWGLDTVLARARLARDLRCTRPELGGPGQGLRLADARNPILLLLGREVVPIAPELPAAGGGLVVSGPNAGGKSVALSTVGLCCTLVRFGLLPPVGPGSVVPWYDQVFTVIGDPTSMDRAVSTFTGQLARVREVLERKPGRALVLLDELATGTEPRRGEALAVAILRELADGGAECLVTTHYDAVKRLPGEDARFTNARVELDARTGLPSYRLATGSPGESNPFEIAASVGFPARVLEAAKSLVDQRERRLDEAIAEAERLKATLKLEREDTEDLRHRLADDKKRYERELARLRSDADRLVYEARREVLQKMKRLEDELDQIAKAARAERTEARKIVVARQDVRGKKDQVQRDMAREATLVEGVPAEAFPPEELAVGVRVYVVGLRAEGTVVELASDRKRVTVQVGLLKTATRAAELRRPKAAGAKAAPKPAPSRHASAKGPEMPLVPMPGVPAIEDGPVVRSDRNTVDCRGMRLDEAVQAVDRLLDDAWQREEEAVLVVHGMGTSALRKGVREYLKSSRYVKRFRPGEMREGGDGVTIVYL
jgi:DNA mismatch repair protein MutS2